MKKFLIYALPILLAAKITSAQTINISALTSVTYCAGSSFSVPYTISGTFNAGNIFTVQLSNEAGSFAAPLLIGTITSVTNGTISATIPSAQGVGTSYRIRIMSNSPAITSADNGVNISVIINPFPNITPLATPSNICAGLSSKITSGISATKFNVSSIPYTKIPVPANATNPGLTGDDVNSSDITLPFSFNFYGPSYTKFRVSTNGNIQFGSIYYTSYQIVSFPTTNVKNFIALCWADIVVASNGNTKGKIRYFTDGTAPNRKMIIDYDSCAFFTGLSSSTGFFAGQIWLYETSNIIEVHLLRSEGLACCADVPNSFKTIGVLNAAGTIGNAAPGRNGTAWQTTTAEAWRFTPPGDYTYTWTPAASLNIATSDTVTATPSATTTYNVSATNIYTGCVARGSTIVNVNPLVTPAVAIDINAGTNPTCSGSAITFAATPTNGGVTPTYQWQKNSTIVPGQSGSTYTTASVNNNDSIKCILTSNASCLATSAATSNKITMTVNPSVTPSVNISALPSGVIPPGTSVTFTANVVNGGSAPVYQWKKNGVVVSTNQTYTNSSWTSGDNITCTITSNAPCATVQTVTSNTISVTLPLTLVSFTATSFSSYVNCIWQTATEINTSHFIIQRSSDGNTFFDIGKITASGNSSINKDYAFTDREPGPGINYYRLQMADKDGQFTLSKVVAINVNSKEVFSVYPNPAINNLFVRIKRTISEKIVLQITDIQGKRSRSQTVQLKAGINTLSINTSNLSRGSYILILKGEMVEKKIFVKE